MEVELIGVKSPEEMRRGAEVIEIEDSQSQVTETDTREDDPLQPTKEAIRQTGGRGGGGERLRVRTEDNREAQPQPAQRMENPYKKGKGRSRGNGARTIDNPERAGK